MVGRLQLNDLVAAKKLRVRDGARFPMIAEQGCAGRGEDLGYWPLH